MKREDIAILVVDDVNTVRVQIRELLKSFGFEKITMVSNGLEAQVALEIDRYHIVLADWHMAPIDGIELLKHVRSKPQLQKMAFVMVTAENTKEKVIEAIKSGVDDFVVKPLTPMQIQNKVFGALLKKMV